MVKTEIETLSERATFYLDRMRGHVLKQAENQDHSDMGRARRDMLLETVTRIDDITAQVDGISEGVRTLCRGKTGA